MAPPGRPPESGSLAPVLSPPEGEGDSQRSGLTIDRPGQPLCSVDDGREMSEGQRIGTGLPHVPEGDPEIGQRAGPVVLLQSPDGPLQPQGAEVEKLSGRDGFAHGGTIAPAPLPGNFGLLS